MSVCVCGCVGGYQCVCVWVCVGGYECVCVVCVYVYILMNLYCVSLSLNHAQSLFSQMAKLDGNYFLCDLDCQMELAQTLSQRKIEMEMSDLFCFTLAPVDLRKTDTVKALCYVRNVHMVWSHKHVIIRHTSCYCTFPSFFVLLVNFYHSLNILA